MTDGDVTTRSKSGQWVNHVEGHPESSQSFSSREEAVIVGATLAAESGAHHRVVEADPTGTINDGGSPQEEPAIVGDKDAEATELSQTTDENGMPLDNPSG